MKIAKQFTEKYALISITIYAISLFSMVIFKQNYFVAILNLGLFFNVWVSIYFATNNQS